jgi:hypothetical protein
MILVVVFFGLSLRSPCAVGKSWAVSSLCRFGGLGEGRSRYSDPKGFELLLFLVDMRFWRGVFERSRVAFPEGLRLNVGMAYIKGSPCRLSRDVGRDKALACERGVWCGDTGDMSKIMSGESESSSIPRECFPRGISMGVDGRKRERRDTRSGLVLSKPRLRKIFYKGKFLK